MMGICDGEGENSYEDAYNNGKQAGIKEVVGWLEKNGAWLYRIMGMMTPEQKEALEGKLKEWGIK